jgi:hypothetical protein
MEKKGYDGSCHLSIHMLCHVSQSAMLESACHTTSTKKWPMVDGQVNQNGEVFSSSKSNQKKIQYLGHIISTDGIAVDLEKIEAIRGWPTPRNVTEVGSFMGLVDYYRRFIKGFSKIANPITSLQKKGVKFEWTSKCEESFQ